MLIIIVEKIFWKISDGRLLIAKIKYETNKDYDNGRILYGSAIN